jgi:hypothetical protein
MIMVALLSNSSSEFRADRAVSDYLLLDLLGSGRDGDASVSALALVSCFLLELFMMDFDMYLLFYLDRLDLECWALSWLLLLVLYLYVFLETLESFIEKRVELIEGAEELDNDDDEEEDDNGSD